MKDNSKLYTIISSVIGVVLAIAVAVVMVVHAAPPTTSPSVTKTASSEIASTESEIIPTPTYTEDELFCMAAAIYNEAGGDACSDDTRRLVGYVILNRVNDARFPNTIREVLEQRCQYGRFWITGVKFADRCSLPQETEAVDRAYRIAKEVLETENIPIPPTVVFQAEFKQGTSIYKHQDGLYFCHL